VVEGGSVVSGGKFSVGECAVEEGAMKERASSHVRLTEYDYSRLRVKLPHLEQLLMSFYYILSVISCLGECLMKWLATSTTVITLMSHLEVRTSYVMPEYIRKVFATVHDGVYKRV